MARRKTLSRLLLVGALILGALMLLATSSLKDPSPIGVVNFLLGGPGDVTLQHKGADNWLNAELKMKVLDGDKVKTLAESRCEVKLNDGSVVRIGENTLFDFGKASVTAKGKEVEGELAKGKMWANVTKSKGKKEKFQIKAPTAVCAIRGTIYRMDADSTTKVLVYDGAVDVGPLSKVEPEKKKAKSLQPYQIPGPYEIPPPYQVSLEEWVRIVKGFQIEVRKDGKFAKSRFNEQEDAKLPWVQWNKERDKLLSK